MEYIFVIAAAGQFNDDEEDERKSDVGGLFKVVQPSGKESDKKKLRRGLNDVDCSSFPVDHVRNWTVKEVGL